MQTYKEAEQITLFDVDGSCGRTFQVPSQATQAMISGASSKKSQKSSKKMPIYLDLRRADGHTQGASWSEGVLSLGSYTMLSTGAYLSVGNEFAYSLTSTDTSHPTYYLLLNTGELPREANPTILSDILEMDASPKYDLSPTACQGILNRAGRRGKQLPEILQKALEAQATTAGTSSPSTSSALTE